MNAGAAMNEVAGFYDDLAAGYHRIFADWAASVRHQGEVLDTVIRAELGEAEHLILDCAVGIGTQLLGLAEHGHRVAGADLSPAAVRRAWTEAEHSGVPPALAVADMRALPFADGVFDAVVCADNAVAHLMDAEALAVALNQMRRVVRRGGLVLVTVRDYDTLRAERPAVLPTHLSRSPAGLRVTVPLFEWSEDGQTYLLRQLQLDEQPGGGWRAVERRVRCRAHVRADLGRAAQTSGLTGVRWVMPADSGFFQPLLLATAG